MAQNGFTAKAGIHTDNLAQIPDWALKDWLLNYIISYLKTHYVQDLAPSPKRPPPTLNLKL